MALEGKFIWIWELNRCDNGNIDSIIKIAKDIGIDGYILKTHDGPSFWYQAHAISEIKNAGLKCGAWGYCYGKNVTGEISAIKKSASFNPDFYVVDMESEFEASNMRTVAEQILSEVKDIGIPLGYSSFAIPSYHSVPFDILSKYCTFTMPQIYWVEMKWQVKTAFDSCIGEYNQYDLPIYPIGQLTNDIPSSDIQEFNKLCNSINSPVISYWDLQDASHVQLNALKESIDEEFTSSVKKLKDQHIIESTKYWIENAVRSKTIDGEYARLLILRAARKLS